MATLQPELATVAPPTRVATRAIPDWLLPIALVLVLTAAWTLQHWSALSMGRLPDTDDMMRLAQIRDWIGGQGFADLRQHRLGDGLAMHWSRIGDVGPAAMILMLRPMLGGEAAELAAVIAWPALLFVALLFVIRRIARDLGGPTAVPIATILGALAYPTVAFFMPGRIDHHGLQAVLVAIVVAALATRASRHAGVVGGVATAVSLALGLEAAPLLLAAMGASGLAWAVRGPIEDDRICGFAAGLSIALVAALILLRPLDWNEGWCDALTPASGRILLLIAGAWSALSIVGERVSAPRGRIVIGFGLAALLGAGAALWSPICFTGPYGPVDPMLMRLWMANVAEAGPLFGIGGIGLAWAQAGLIAVGAAALIHRLVRRPDARGTWWPFAIVFLVGALGVLAQIRLTYIVAILAVVPLAALIADLRARVAAGERVTMLMLAAWIAATGILHGMAGQGIAARRDALPSAVAGPSCTSAEAMIALSKHPAGRIAAPMDTGAYLIGMTAHAPLAAPYHRNNRGNRLLYELMLAPPDRAQAIARGAALTYVLVCPSAYAELTAKSGWRASLAANLLRGEPPDWLVPVSAPTGLALFQMRFHATAAP